MKTVRSASTDTLVTTGLLAVTAALLYLLVWDLRPYPFLGWVDDYKYVKTAWHLGQFEWLGPYDATTLIKRPLFSVILALTSAAGLPFDLFQIFFYLCGVALFIRSLLRFGLPRGVAVPLFAMLGFVPTLYDADGSRVLRETVTVGLEFVILSIALGLLLGPPAASLWDWLKGWRGLKLILLYGLSAFHWGMREEGILLSGVLAPLLAAAALWTLKGPLLARLGGAAVFCGGLAVAIAATYLAIASANFLKYGVFLVNDLSEGEFPKVVGVLKSIQEGPEPELLLHISETQKLLERSPRFRPVGERLYRIQQEIAGIDYSHQMFFLRVAGMRGTEMDASATASQRYFHELYEELTALCAQGALKCAPNPKLAIIPRYSWTQWRNIPSHARRLTGWLLRTRSSGFDFLSRSYPGVEPVPPEVLERFIAVTRQQPFGWDGVQTEFTLPGKLEDVHNQQSRRAALGRVYGILSPILYGFAVIGLAAGCSWAWKTGQHQWLVPLAVLGAHVTLRIMAFSYLSAMDDGVVPVRLIRPAYPFGLAFAVLAIALGITARRSRQVSGAIGNGRQLASGAGTA